MAENQLHITEKWASDLEAYEKGGKNPTSYPQCESCAFYIRGDALHCQKYRDVNKPSYVLFPEKECGLFVSNAPLKITAEDKMLELIYAGIFGFIIGDVLGVPAEFSSRPARKMDPFCEMRAYGTHHQPFGSWSDDTSFMLCLLDAINQGYSIDKIKENMIACYKEGRFTPRGDLFDIGISTVEAVHKMINGVPAVQCGGSGERDNGNGSLMRVLPLAFMVSGKDPFEIIALVRDVSSLTHRHPRSVLACIFYVIFAGSLIQGKTLDEAYHDAVDFLNMYCKFDFGAEFKTYNYVLNEKVIGFDVRQIRSSGYVVDTLEAVLWTLFHTSSYEEAVLTAVNLGDDTDTIAALTGGLAGIYYGLDQIPDRWIQNVLRKEEISDMILKFRVAAV